MSVNLHVLDVFRSDLTDLLAMIVDRNRENLAGTIRVDHFFNANGLTLGTHLFYVIFREPGSVAMLTAFLCGAGSGNFTHSAQAFKRLMDALFRSSAPFWSMHPHSDMELYQLFGTTQDWRGFVRPNEQVMQGFHPGQYQVDFLARSDQFIPAIQMIQQNLPVDVRVHEAFLSTALANYRLMWESLYGIRPS